MLIICMRIGTRTLVFLLHCQFFTDAKESLDYLKNLQDAIQRKYGCDRTSSLHKLEDLVQESMVRRKKRKP